LDKLFRISTLSRKGKGRTRPRGKDRGFRTYALAAGIPRGYGWRSERTASLLERLSVAFISEYQETR
jgi:hypothetical protein